MPDFAGWFYIAAGTEDKANVTCAKRSTTLVSLYANRTGDHFETQSYQDYHQAWKRPRPGSHHSAWPPAAYLVDVETYEDTQKRLTVLEGIARGERAIEEGRIVSQSQAKKRLARWLT